MKNIDPATATLSSSTPSSANKYLLHTSALLYARSGAAMTIAETMVGWFHIDVLSQQKKLISQSGLCSAYWPAGCLPLH